MTERRDSPAGRKLNGFDGHDPSDEPSANVVRAYTLTAGRTRSHVDVPIEATLVVTDEGSRHEWAPHDPSGQVVSACSDNPSVAEVAVRTSLPLGVTRVLVGDLVARGHLTLRATMTDATPQDERISLIERTLRGLRKL